MPSRCGCSDPGDLDVEKELHASRPRLHEATFRTSEHESCAFSWRPRYERRFRNSDLHRRWPLLDRIEAGDILPADIVTHRFALTDAPHAYEVFRDKTEECIKC
jgi:threonine dehydrogenase-like Zn-dependent dehydrogenase